MTSERLLASLIEVSKTLGWSIENNGVSNCLINTSHPSMCWAAEWSKHKTLDGKDVYVPHWFPDVLNEQIKELVELEEAVIS